MYIPVSTAQLAFSGNDKLGMLELTAGDAGPEEVQAIVNTIKGQLSERHGFSPDDAQAVHVHNNVEQFQRFSMMFYMISAFVVVIGLGTLAAGVGLCELIGRAHVSDFILNPGINLSTGIAATLFLVFAGALAGFFPARAAARVNPIHALRDQ
jgi:putative ABC transport system permease protein